MEWGCWDFGTWQTEAEAHQSHRRPGAASPRPARLEPESGVCAFPTNSEEAAFSFQNKI